jgi:hypothetical protein
MSADVPYSRTDLAKALRILVRTSEDIRKIVSPIYRRWHYRDVAKNLDALMFRPRGMRDPLSRLKTGKGTPDDKALLAKMLSASAGQVTQAIADLEGARDRVRERFGMPRVMELDDIIYDKIMIRDCLSKIANDPELLLETPTEAVETYKYIEKLNRETAKSHERLMAPRYSASNCRIITSRKLPNGEFLIV